MQLLQTTLHETAFCAISGSWYFAVETKTQHHERALNSRNVEHRPASTTVVTPKTTATAAPGAAVQVAHGYVIDFDLEYHEKVNDAQAAECRRWNLGGLFCKSLKLSLRMQFLSETFGNEKNNRRTGGDVKIAFRGDDSAIQKETGRTTRKRLQTQRLSTLDASRKRSPGPSNSKFL